MTLSDIAFEMELNGVDKEDIDDIIQLSKKQGVMLELIDDELVKRGYERIFEVNYDEYDEWDDDDYSSVEKIRSKNHWSD